MFSEILSPVCLPSIDTKRLFVGKEAVVVGWGALREGSLFKNESNQIFNEK